MKKVLLMLLCCLVFAAGTARASEENQFAFKLGYMHSLQDESTDVSNIEIGGAVAVGGEYYTVIKRDNVVSLSGFYSSPDLSGMIFNRGDGLWYPVNGNFNLWNFSVNLYHFAHHHNGNIENYKGAYYGLGLSYSMFKMSNTINVGGTVYNMSDLIGRDATDDINDDSLDFNLIFGYKFRRDYGMDLRWIVDEQTVLWNHNVWF